MYLSYPEGQAHPANAPRGEVENVHEAALRRLGMTDSNFVAYPPPDSDEVLRYSTRVSTIQAYRPVGNKNTDSHGNKNTDSHTIFVSQIPKTLPLNCVPWAIDTLLKEYGSEWVLQTQANGCAKVTLRTEDQAGELIRQNKALLFDINGVWIARTEEEKKVMRDYQSNLHVVGQFDPRLCQYGAIIEKVRPPQRTAQSQHLQSTQAFFPAYPTQPLPPGYQAVNPQYLPPGFPRQ